MAAIADLTDAEIGELDDLLAAIPEPLEALDVVMLDGYLCGVLAQPRVIDPAQWQPPAFDWNLLGAAEAAAADAPAGTVLTPDTPGWHSAKHERLLALVMRRHAALAQGLIDGWFDPLVMQPLDDDGQPLKGKEAMTAALAPWVIGFEHALEHFQDLESLDAPELPDLLACLWRHLPEQSEDERAESQALDQEHPLTSLDAAIDDLVGNVVELADLARAARVKVETVRRDQPKVGRNDPCPCGSGRKFKQCHGKDGA
ncbi:UPF0149 family protein [Leptothrix discophora]|uniref:UPF0149 family protein n=1 Tax=Leptothrix discophora TaxID=89 RepID=A0ABT9G8Q4_LEPDI|nr:UPF0149 family protein [Leptothrix discophora]MDP4302864.1 UPF0149 family protein [Leptothrix discophora]